MLCRFSQSFRICYISWYKFKLLQTGTGTIFYNVIKFIYAKSQFFVRISHVLTECFNVDVGVRQGDPLSPNLFKIFINDLPSSLESTPDPENLNKFDLHCLIYADDLVILSESAKGLQEKLDKLQNFL